MADADLKVESVSKAFGHTQALDSVDLEVAPGEIHALLGSNGSGKSTLIKILAGVYGGDSGTLRIGDNEIDLTSHTPLAVRDAGLFFVHQESSVFPSLSVAENLELGRAASGLKAVSRSSVRARARQTLERFGIDVDPGTTIQTLAPAQQAMVTIARTLQDDEESHSRVLVLDEPTATLEAGDVKTLFEALRRYAAEGQTIVFVTHRLEEVVQLADRATVLRDGRNAGALRREEFSEKALGELIVGRPLEAYFSSPVTRREDVPILEVSEARGNRVEDITLSIYGGEIVGLAGLAGSGNSELLRLVFGIDPLDSGEVRIDGSAVSLKTPQDAMDAGVAYVPADRHTDGIFPELSVRENLGMATLGDHRSLLGFDRRGEGAHAAEDIERFGIVTSSQSALVSSLSGGNQQKVVVARWLRRNPRLLLLEDPTQGIDIGARAELWAVIDKAVEEATGVLMTSSDLEEMARVCNRILIVRGGRISAELEADSVTADDLTELIHTAPTEASL
jgi:ribose transport system ATP-binding protein